MRWSERETIRLRAGAAWDASPQLRAEYPSRAAFAHMAAQDAEMLQSIAWRTRPVARDEALIAACATINAARAAGVDLLALAAVA